MSEFEYKFEGKYIRECSSCQWEAPLKKTEYRSRELKNGERFLCEVCCKTRASSVTDYVDQYPDRDIYIMIAQTANLLLDKLYHRKPPKETKIKEES